MKACFIDERLTEAKSKSYRPATRQRDISPTQHLRPSQHRLGRICITAGIRCHSLLLSASLAMVSRRRRTSIIRPWPDH